MVGCRTSEDEGAHALPAFRYHPDPVGTGGVVRSDRTCLACGRVRGWVCTGAVSATDDLDDGLCPWCVSDGSAAARFGATSVAVGDAPALVPRAVLQELTERTPGFTGWQQERWLFHCQDACAYLGRLGAADLDRVPDARQSLEQECAELGLTADATADYLGRLHPDGDLTAYLFRCLHCGTHLAYSDGN